MNRPILFSIVYTRQILLLALLYIITGKLGLFLAIPPGYATVIWPPSGIALGALLVYGRRLWPGILIGSFLLNCYITAEHLHAQSLAHKDMLVAFGIAVGSTLQAVFACWLLRRYIGLPLRLTHVREVLRLFLLVGPLSCVIAATVGCLMLLLSGAMKLDGAGHNWVAWWAGDMFGILVFLPLVLVSPWHRNRVLWRNHEVGAMPTLAMLLLILPLGLTFYAWKLSSESTYKQAVSEFDALTQESQRALLHRLDSYQSALLGGAGFFQGSQHVSREEWRNYVNTIAVKEHFPGMNGIGWIQPVEHAAIPNFIARTAADGVPDFTIHPPVQQGPVYVITYIDPERGNRKAVGLNIAFEPHRLEAAELSRDTGKAAITKRIVLVQDEKHTPGFLLLYPVYQAGKITALPDERRNALRGWVYAPFIASAFLSQLTESQGRWLNVRIYDQGVESPDTLIYDSGGGNRAKAPSFTVRRTVDVMQQRWLIVWESTPAYDQRGERGEPFFILIGGIVFTAMFGIFLLVVSARREEAIESLMGRRKLLLPALVFFLLAGVSYALSSFMAQKEHAYLAKRVEDDAYKMELLLTAQMENKFQALKRMAQRWETSGRISPAVWHEDAANYLQDMPGLRTLEWVDATYHVRQVEPAVGNEGIIGLDIRYNEERKKALEGAEAQHRITVTPPMQLRQGYTGFIVYVPLYVRDRFDGFIAAIFAVERLFRTTLAHEIEENYTIALNYNDINYYTKTHTETDKSWTIVRHFAVYDTVWALRMTPTEAFIRHQRTQVPQMVFVGGLTIALLAALALRYLLIARLRSKYLATSNQLNTAILSGAAYLIVATDEHGTVITFNAAAERTLGYKADEIVGKQTPAIWHDMNEIEVRAQELSKELGETVPAGFDVFIRKAIRDGVESREWTFIRKDGSRFPVNLTVTVLTQNGQITGYLGVVEDITERRQREQELHATFEQMRLLVKNTPAAVAMFDQDLHYLMTSDRWLQDYNLQGRHIIGRSHYEIFPEILNIPRWMDIHRRALQGEVFAMHEESWVRMDGTQEWVKWAIHPWINSKGEIGGIVMFTEVITDRKQAEEALRTSEETFRSAMESASIGMALVVPNGHWLEVNRALCELFGYTREEILANDFQSITHPEDLARDLDLLNKTLAGEIKGYHLEKRYYHKTGRIIWGLLSVSLVRDAHGNPNYLITQIQDITERKQVDRIKSEFISTVSHELRTPLTAIRGSLGIIATMRDLNAKTKTLVDIAYSNCERLILLINDILDIDKIASGNMRLSMVREQIAAVTARAAQGNEAYAHKYQVTIMVGPMDPHWYVMLDADRYLQVLANLLSNAAKFSPQGGVVDVRGERRGDRVRISVIDYGAGIPEEFRGRIFGKFSQADSSSSRAKGGTGLGLHITRQLVELMGGVIGFDTEVGKGTTFWVEFPLAPDETT